jgi:hypothetical protein
MKKYKPTEVKEKMAKETKTKNKPDIQSKSGIFQISGWKNKRTIPAKNDFDIEREVEQINICLNIGQRTDGKWKNIPTWFRASQFQNLKEVLEDFTEKLKDLSSEKQLEREIEEEVVE